MSARLLKILKWFSIAAISILLLLVIVWFLDLSFWAKSKLWFLHTGGRWGHYALGGNYSGVLPSLSPDNSKFVFSSPLSGFGDIYSINSDGSNRRRLTRSRNCEVGPSFSPDGLKICYVREHNYRGQIYVMDADESNQTRLTFGRDYCYNPLFSPDSRKIVFIKTVKRPKIRYRRSEIYVINIDGSDLRRLTDNDVNEEYPTFSRDGKSVYYYIHLLQGEKYKVYATEIWRVDLETLEEKRVVTMPIEAYYIQYSPDFKKIVFISYCYEPWESRSYRIYTANIDGTDIQKLPQTGSSPSYPSFSADGSKIIFLSGLAAYEKVNIFIMNSDGSNPKAIGID